jgi:hypothetical protein
VLDRIGRTPGDIPANLARDFISAMREQNNPKPSNGLPPLKQPAQPARFPIPLAGTQP